MFNIVYITFYAHKKFSFHIFFVQKQQKIGFGNFYKLCHFPMVRLKLMQNAMVLIAEKKVETFLYETKRKKVFFFIFL